MGELYLLLNVKNDLIYKLEHHLTNDAEFCRKYLLAYSSVDILNSLILTTNESFIPCILRDKKSVSAYVMRCGIKIIMVTENRRVDEIKKLALKIRKILHLFFVESFVDFFEMIEDNELDRQIEEIL